MYCYMITHLFFYSQQSQKTLWMQTLSEPVAGSEQYSVLKQQYDQLSAEYYSCQLSLKNLEDKIKTYAQKDRENRELKSELADCKFQLKKVEEDVAGERTKLEMDRIRFLKGYESKIQELKDKIESDNSDWMRRYDLREEEHRESQRILNENYLNLTQQAAESAKKQLESRVAESERRCRKEFQKLEEDYLQLQQNFRTQQQKLMDQSQRRIKEEVKVIIDKTNLQLSKKQKEYEIRLSIIQNQKRQQVNQHQNTKKQFVSVKDTLYEQIYQLTTHKDDLQGQVKDFRTEIEEKTLRILNLNNSIKELEVKYETQINSYVENSKKNLENIQSKTTGDIEQVLRNQLLYVETMQHKIKSLEDKHNQQLKAYKSQLENIKQCYEQRPSKVQDIDSIRTLKEKLWKKERDFEFLQDELKWFKLQVNNKEDMYTKMFAGGYTGELKSMTNNQDRLLTRSPLQSREYQAKRVGRSLLMKRKDDSKTSYGSFPNSRGNN